MTMSEMTHRFADAFKRMTDRLIQLRDTQSQQPLAKTDQEGSIMPDKRSDTD
jgi:hypothetical protein